MKRFFVMLLAAMLIAAMLLTFPCAVAEIEMSAEDMLRLGVAYKDDSLYAAEHYPEPEGVVESAACYYAEMAVEWLTSAVEAGSVAAMYELGELYLHGCDYEMLPEIEDGMAWLTKAAEGGDTRAMCLLGSRCVPEKSGRLWLEKAAEQGNAEAMRALGDFWLMGLFGTENQTAEAEHWLIQALNAGDDGAVTQLFILYTVVEEDTPENRAHLIALLTPSAEAGSVKAMESIASTYLGFGIIGEDPYADYSAAAAWYHKAAEAGSVEAMDMLGTMYGQENFGMMDLEEALFWDRCAALHGNQNAIRRLESMQ